MTDIFSPAANPTFEDVRGAMSRPVDAFNRAIATLGVGSFERNGGDILNESRDLVVKLLGWRANRLPGDRLTAAALNAANELSDADEVLDDIDNERGYNLGNAGAAQVVSRAISATREVARLAGQDYDVNHR